MNIYRCTFSWSNKIYTRSRQKKLDSFTLEESSHFLYYHRSASPDVDLVRNEFNAIYAPINRLYQFTPPDKVPVIIYDSPKLMKEALHWRSAAAPMGIYWLGYINILAPSAWISSSPAELECVFRLLGPVAHEYTHYVIDHLTYGNYPRWLSEGLAQFTEQLLAKSPPVSPRSLLNEDFYSLDDLESHFDLLPNQGLAYMEALFLGEILVEQLSFSHIRWLLHKLQGGSKFFKLLRNSRLNYPTLNLLLQNRLWEKRKFLLQCSPHPTELS